MLVTDLNSPLFDSYASLDDLRGYAKTRGYEIPDSDDDCEQLLMQAMDYLAGLSWKGNRKSGDQPLAWPRTGIMFDGYPIIDNAIPKQIVQSQCRLAIDAQNIDLAPVIDGGGDVIQESISGAISVTYAEGTTSSAPKITWLNGALKGFITGAGQIRVVRG